LFLLTTTQLLAIDVNTQALVEGLGRIVVVLLLAAFAAWAIKRFISPVLRVAIREQMAGEPEIEVAKRINTLTEVVYRTTVTVISIVAIVTILPEFGLNPGPLIAGLGLVGLAVGFGAQNIVRDVINGLEILIENQYARGDFVKLGNFTGIVEDINLRRTMLRDIDGNVHFVSHGQVEVTSNYTRGYSRVALVIGVPYDSDLTHVYEVIDRIGREIAASADFSARVRQPPLASSIERINETTVDVRIVGVTEPGEQWHVESELRLRLKRAFDAEGILVRDAAPLPAR
jgi:moderate conductance mechanosensitive channel